MILFQNCGIVRNGVVVAFGSYLLRGSCVSRSAMRPICIWGSYKGFVSPSLRVKHPVVFLWLQWLSRISQKLSRWPARSCGSMNRSLPSSTRRYHQSINLKRILEVNISIRFGPILNSHLKNTLPTMPSAPSTPSQHMDTKSNARPTASPPHWK